MLFLFHFGMYKNMIKLTKRQKGKKEVNLKQDEKVSYKTIS